MDNQPKHDPASGPDERESLLARFLAVSTRFHRTIGHAGSAAAAGEMTMPQYYIMRLVADDECLRVSDLADRLAINPSAVTAMVDRLVSKGFVERRRDRDDRRIVHVCATQAGLEVLGKVTSGSRSFIGQAFGRLDLEEARCFVESYEKIASLLTDSEAESDSD